MRINHNISALNTHRQMTNNVFGANKALEKLSSGLRINRAGDDAAGLAISEKMRGQIRGLEMASKNAQDGISLIQTAEGALNETHSILQRMRELAVQAANDTSTDSDRAELQKEVAQLKSEIDRIATTTEFNTKKLLNGDLSAALEAQGSILETAQIKESDLRSLLFDPQENAVNIDATGGLTFDVALGTNTLTVDVAQGVYTLEELAAQINADFKASGNFSGVSVTVRNGKLSFVNNEDSEITIKTSATAANYLGIHGDITIQKNEEHLQSVELDAFNLDGQIAITVNKNGSDATITIASGDYSDLDALATAIGGAIGGGLSGLKVRVQGDKLSFYFEATANTKDAVFTISKVSGASAEKFYTSLDKLGLKANSQVSNKVTLLSLSDTDGSSLGVKVGDKIRLNGEINGKAFNEYTFDVKAESTLDELLSGIAGELGLQKDDVAFENGKLVIRGKDGSKNDLQNFKLSIDGNAAFNNRFSNFKEIQDARDAKSDNSLSFHIGANEGQNMKVSFSEMTVDALNLASVDISTQQGASNSITVINNALERVSTERAKMGAVQNRLEHTINNLGTSAENLTASESRIRDVDMAKEMMEFTKNNILTQAAQAMLAQANQQPQGVLQLLR